MSDATTSPRRIAGRYRVERAIGRGGMGTVWLCRDERLERDVAVKQVGLLPGESAPDLARAMREARSSAALNHPHVVSVYDILEADDHIWLVMEYVEGRTLSEVIAQDGPLAPEVAGRIGAQVAEGLAAAHAAGTVHRDVKPGNILITTTGVAKISDFGIARAHDQEQLTRSGIVVGTPAYFSPELARGEEPAPPSDVWALGASLFAAVEGHPPYDDRGNALALLATIASADPPQTRHARGLAEPIGRMMDPDPDTRWTMERAARELARPMAEWGAETVAMSPPTAPEPVLAPEPAPDPEPVPVEEAEDDDDRGGRGLLVLAGVLAAVLLLGGLVGWSLLRGQGGDTPTAGDTPSHSTSHDAKPKKKKHSASTAPSTPASKASSPTSAPASTTAPPVVSGSDGARFVQDYYAALPSDTQAGWDSLTTGFQQKIGSYDDYRGFWSTISSVSVGRTTPRDNAVDVALTYTRNDGSRSSEVRRLYLQRDGSSWLISGDAIVG